MEEQFVRGPILNPLPTGRVEFYPDGILVSDSGGRIRCVGPAEGFLSQLGSRRMAGRSSSGILIPPMLDAHIHIPQWPIRGNFTKGVSAGGHGRLIEGLHKNVFPEEAHHADAHYSAAIVRQFHEDTLAKGVVGGFAYMTAHAAATRQALRALPAEWSVGLVLMDQNCPDYLCTDPAQFEGQIESLAAAFGPRCVVTDRFAVSVSAPVRRRASALARRHRLPTQTHLNEQRAEKRLVERELYPDAASYADVYRRDGLLDRPCLCAHCIWMRQEEWRILRDCGAAVGHCPTSNTLLGSGIMDLDAVKQHGIPWSLCTDVGASPTTSLLAEMARFLTVHDRRHATTAEEALCATTLYPARLLGLDSSLGSFEAGKDFSYVEVEPFGTVLGTAEEVVRRNILGLVGGAGGCLADAERPLLDRLAADGIDDAESLALLEHQVKQTAGRLDHRILTVILKGAPVFSRSRHAHDLIT